MHDLVLAGSGDSGTAADKRAIRAHAAAVINLRFREEHLGVGDVAAYVGVSRRQLHAVLSEAGQSPYSMILQRRVTEGLRLLQDPGRAELTITDVARLTGFNGQTQFSRVMSKELGLSPSAIRAGNHRSGQRNSMTTRSDDEIATSLSMLAPQLLTLSGTARPESVGRCLAAAAANTSAAVMVLRSKSVVGASAVMRCNALKFVDENFRNTLIDAGAIAEHMGIGVRQLHAILAGDGQTVAGVLRERRTREGIRLLSDPRYSELGLPEIAERSGFGAVASFTRAIRAATGRSPSALRRGAFARDVGRIVS